MEKNEKYSKTHASSLIQRVVKFCLHSDLSIWMWVYKRKPQVGVIPAPKGKEIRALSCLNNLPTAIKREEEEEVLMYVS